MPTHDTFGVSLRCALFVSVVSVALMTSTRPTQKTVNRQSIACIFGKKSHSYPNKRTTELFFAVLKIDEASSRALHARTERLQTIIPLDQCRDMKRLDRGIAEGASRLSGLSELSRLSRPNAPPTRILYRCERIGS